MTGYTHGMDLHSVATSVALAIGLAACAGLRAWLPLFLAGVLARHGWLAVSPAYGFLASDRALLLFGAATLVEIVGDKIPAVDHALESFPKQPHLMQRFARARVVAHPVWNEEKQAEVMMQGRVRLCPYYFVIGGEARLSGALATVVPADKKLLHGMKDAAMVPCVAGS